MTRQSTIENRLGRIEQALERGGEDRAETNRKIDSLDAKFDAVLATNGETAGAVRQLAQSAESRTRSLERLSSDNCGARLTGLEAWMPKIEKRLADLEQPRELRRVDEDRLAACERACQGWDRIKQRAWQFFLAAVGSGALAGLGASFLHHVR